MSYPDLPSLLWPTPQRTTLRHALTDLEELGVTTIARALDPDGQHGRFMLQTLSDLPTDPPTIRYRQEILHDFLDAPQRVSATLSLLPRLRSLNEAPPFQPRTDESALLQILTRLSELEQYVGVIEELWQICTTEPLHADGLQRLQEAIDSRRNSESFQRLTHELPALRAQLDQVGSVVIGINLDPQLRPQSATILELSPRQVAGKPSVLERLFGAQQAQDILRGITALYTADEQRAASSEHTLFRDLNRMLSRVAEPIAGAIGQFHRVQTNALAGLEPELAWYAGAARLFRELIDHGHQFCAPTITSPTERHCHVDHAYSLDLALRRRFQAGPPLVANQINITGEQPITFVTGPNSGGKTTYLRTVGQAHVLAQAGLLVAGTAAHISPADAILTHFAAPEHPHYDTGRLDEELGRLSTIIYGATPQSCILLNEPLTTTDHRSALQIGTELISAFRLLGARMVFVTHLHDLVEKNLVAEPGIATCGSLVAHTALQDDQEQPSFLITAGPPQPHSLARERAAAHGLTLDQLRDHVANTTLAKLP